MPIRPRQAVLDAIPYVPPSEGRLKFTRMDFCETPDESFVPDLGIVEANQVAAYPEYNEFASKLAKFYALSEDAIALTNGSDEALAVITQTFIACGDSALVSSPCFALIPYSAKLSGAELVEVPVTADFQFDLIAIEKALSADVKIAIFASPDNPTGATLAPSVVSEWCAKYPNTLFVIDEAYGEYFGQSCLQLTSIFANLLVTKTFSKAWGLAGLRLGFVVGNAELIDYVKRVKLPYSVNSAAICAASALIDRANEIQDSVEETIRERDRIVASLRRSNYKLISGPTNFFLLGMGPNAKPFAEYAQEQGILIRNRSAGYIRVSVSTKQNNDKFIGCLKEFAQRFGIVFDLDATLVDTTESFDRTVLELVSKYSPKATDVEELQNLRAEGGYNDDWIAAQELLRRRGTSVALAEITEVATTRYLELAPKVERMLCSPESLQRLQQKYPLFIVTGRNRREYTPIWEDRLAPYFKGVYCVDDVPGNKAKPSPDYLNQVKRDSDLVGAVYIGNNIDDMQAARAAGFFAIGITTTLTAAQLIDAGAQYIIESVDELPEVFMV